MKIRHIIATSLILSCSACAYDVPSQVDPARLEVVEASEQHTYETKALNADTIRSLAQGYNSSGQGQVELTVTYDPRSKKNTAMNATLEAGRIAKLLTDQGVSSVQTKVLPVADSWNISHSFVTYNALTAHAPTGCDRMPGFESADDVGDADMHRAYGYGCTIEAMIAKQIAHPQDLLGQEDQTHTESGRRAENVIWGRGYYGSDQFPVLQGESSSDD